MNKKTRLFLVIAGGVLVVGVGAGLIASYMGLSVIALGGPEGPTELKYVPADSGLVAFADVRELMTSEFRQQLPQHGAAQRRSADLQAETGLNPETDIDSVVISVSAAGAQPGERALVLARGRFDEVKIEHFARSQGGQLSEYKGKRLLQHTGEKGAETALVFLEPGLLAFGSSASVRQAVDLAAGGQNITANDQVMGLMRGVRDGNAWAVGRFDVLTQRARLPREMANRMPPITWFAAAARVGGGVDGLVRLEARDDAAAQNVREVIRGFVALARLQAGGSAALNSVIDSVQLGGEGKTVSLELSVSSTAVAALASELPRGSADGRGHSADDQPVLPAP